MKVTKFLLSFTIFFSFLSVSSPAYVHFDGRSDMEPPVPAALDLEAHDVNEVYLMVSNRGPIGLDLQTGGGRGFFPSNTANGYVYGTGLWFGAHYDADDDGTPDKVFTQGYNPLAGDSEFREGRGDQDQDDPLTRIFDSRNQSDLTEWPPQFSDPGTGDPIVYSDQDLVTTYTTKDKLPVFGAFQLPLEVNQRTMAVISPDSIDQVIFLVFEVNHTGNKVLEGSWIGYDSDMDIGQAFDDDLSSFVLNRVTPGGDTIRLNMGYAWDSDFTENSFIGDPGFVGVSFVLSPGNPDDGFDNDGDGLTDESPFNGIDDDNDGLTDEWDEVDEIGLTNYTKHCNPAAPCELKDPQSDDVGYDILACNAPGDTIECLESTTPADVRFLLSSGPFDWQPGQTQMIVLAMVFSYAVGNPDQIDFVGDPPRPDPNDPALGEFVRITELAGEFFSTLFPPLGIGDDPDGGPGTKLPRAFALHQNYPNPFNPVTTIGFEIIGEVGTQQPVELNVFDMHGRQVRMLVRDYRSPGWYEEQWNGRDQNGRVLPSGTYLYRLKVDDFVSTRRMTLVK